MTRGFLTAATFLTLTASLLLAPTAPAFAADPTCTYPATCASSVIVDQSQPDVLGPDNAPADVVPSTPAVATSGAAASTSATSAAPSTAAAPTTAAPTGATLPLTGGDIAQLTILGAGTFLLGAFLVRRVKASRS
ncbi:MAG TPA: hypothetical protein VGH94_15495 [Acidimicrobiales bacterium]